VGRRLATHVEHAEQHGSKTTRGVGQSQKVGQVKLADHREVFGRSSGHGVKIYARFPGMSTGREARDWRDGEGLSGLFGLFGLSGSPTGGTKRTRQTKETR